MLMHKGIQNSIPRFKDKSGRARAVTEYTIAQNRYVDTRVISSLVSLDILLLRESRYLCSGSHVKNALTISCYCGSS